MAIAAETQDVAPMSSQSVALWDSWHQGPLSTVSHSIFKPTSSEPNASTNRPRLLENTSRSSPWGSWPEELFWHGGLDPFLGLPMASTDAGLPVPSPTTWPHDPHHLSTFPDCNDLMTGQLPRGASLGSTLTNIRMVQLFLLPCKKKDLHINSQAKV